MPIQDVVVGDEVITHRNRWRKVTATTATTYNREGMRLRGQGHPGLVCSLDHKFWAMRREERYVRTHGGTLLPEVTYAKPGWTPAQQLQEHYWSTPATWPKVAGMSITALGQGRRHNIPLRDPDFYWMVGLYLAEGTLSSARGPKGVLDRVTFSLHQDEADEVLRRLKKLGLNASGPYLVKEGFLGINLQLTGWPLLCEWLHMHFGRGSTNKGVPTWALGLPADYRRELLRGWLYGDGHTALNGPTVIHKGTTASKKLAVGMKLLGASLGMSVSMHFADLTQYQASVVDGRPIKRGQHYQVVFSEWTGIQQTYLFDNKIWGPVREVSALKRATVSYSLVVNDDSSYIADGTIVHDNEAQPGLFH